MARAQTEFRDRLLQSPNYGLQPPSWRRLRERQAGRLKRRRPAA